MLSLVGRYCSTINNTLDLNTKKGRRASPELPDSTAKGGGTRRIIRVRFFDAAGSEARL